MKLFDRLNTIWRQTDRHHITNMRVKYLIFEVSKCVYVNWDKNDFTLKNSYQKDWETHRQTHKHNYKFIKSLIKIIKVTH